MREKSRDENKSNLSAIERRSR